MQAPYSRLQAGPAMEFGCQRLSKQCVMLASHDGAACERTPSHPRLDIPSAQALAEIARYEHATQIARVAIMLQVCHCSVVL